MDDTWLLLVYTVPAQPSRLRAAVWREVKKAGAVYLRDGVCALPEQPATRAALQALATKIDGLGGQATLARGARLDPARAADLSAQLTAARAAEHDTIAHEAQRYRRYLAAESAHRALGAGDLAGLEADLTKLQRWAAQVRARDYRGAPGGTQAAALLAQCRAALDALHGQAARRAEAAS